MDVSRVVAWLTVGILLLSTVVSGPLVPAVDVTPPPDSSEFNPYPGRFDATVVAPPPDPLVFVRDGDQYRLANTTVALDIAAVDGSRTVLYNLVIPGVGTSFSTNAVVNRSHVGERIRIAYTNVTVPAQRVARSQYTGEIRIIARLGTDEHVVYGATVTVVFEA